MPFPAQGDGALGSELARIGEEVADDLAQTALVHLDFHVLFRADKLELQVRGNLHHERVVDLLHQVDHRAGLDAEIHLARLDARHIEDIVDEFQQQFVVGVDGLDEELLVFGSEVVRRGQQVAEPHDGIERCAYLVAHVGEERLLESGFLGQLACLVEFALAHLEVVDIGEHAIRFHKLSFTVDDTVAHDFVPVALAVTIEVGLHLDGSHFSCVHLLQCV